MHADAVLHSRRIAVSLLGGTAKKAAVPIYATPGGCRVLQVRVIPTSLAGSSQTYSTWVSHHSTAAIGDADTVFADVDRAVVAGSSHAVAEQVFKAAGEDDFYVFVQSVSDHTNHAFYVMVELDTLAAAGFVVEVVYLSHGTYTQTKRSLLEVA